MSRLYPSRDYYAIKRWMRESHITGRAVAKKAKSYTSTVSETISGASNNRKVLRTLYHLGCPVEMLGLPPDLVKEFKL